MGITVAQAIEIGVLSRGRVLAGSAGLSRMIEHVSVLEIPMPDEPHWIHGNELYITAFFVIRNDRQGQLHTVDVMSRRQVAGLIYQPTPDGMLFPEVLELANRRNFPLIEIPLDIAYIEIITPIMARIFELRTQSLERASMLHRRFIGMLLEGHGLSRLAETIRAMLERPLLLLNDRGMVEASAGLDEPTLRSWQQGIMRAASTYSTVLRIEQGGSAAQILVRPLIGAGRCLGWLVTSQHPALDQDDMLIIEQASTTMTLELIKQEAITASLRSRQDELLVKLLAGRFLSDEQLLSEARQVGWQLQQARVVLIIQVPRTPRTADQSLRMGSPLYAVAQLLQHSSPASVVCQYGDDVLVLAAAPDEPRTAQAEMRRLAEAIVALLGADERYRRVVVAYGGIARAPTALPASYGEAVRALRMRGQFASPAPVVGYDDMRLWILLGEFCQQAETQDWLRAQIGALIDYDRRNKTTFLQTLEVALDHGGALATASEALSIHPNTLKYRLQRIEEILEQNPFASPYRLAYHIAAKLARLGQL